MHFSPYACHPSATGSQRPPQTRCLQGHIPLFLCSLLLWLSEAHARKRSPVLPYSSEESSLFRRYSSPVLLQSSTDRIMQPADLLQFRQSGSHCRSRMRPYTHRYSWRASPPEAYIPVSSTRKAAPDPSTAYVYQRSWFLMRWCNRSHAPYPWSDCRSTRNPPFQKEALPFRLFLLHPVHCPGSRQSSCR